MNDQDGCWDGIGQQDVLFHEDIGHPYSAGLNTLSPVFIKMGFWKRYIEDMFSYLP